MKIILSRTDNIGDVVFTLPMASILKKQFPNCEIYFLGKEYTRSVVELYSDVDKFVTFEQLCDEKFDAIIHVFPNRKVARWAKETKIPLRIGTNRRPFHWLTCNKLVNLTRKNSTLHESQLNIKLLRPFGIDTSISLDQIGRMLKFDKVTKCPEDFLSFINKSKFNLILHPKSKGSAREWSADHFVELCKSLPKDQFKIFISGTKEEEQEIQEKILNRCPEAISLVGKLTLPQFISFIHACDGMVACSTGPLHIAAALGKKAIGLYPPIKTMLPRRWGPLGLHAQSLVGKPPEKMKQCMVKICNKEKKCLCMNRIQVHDVLSLLKGK